MTVRAGGFERELAARPDVPRRMPSAAYVVPLSRTADLRSIGGDGQHARADTRHVKGGSRLAKAWSQGPASSRIRAAKHFVRESLLLNRPDQMPPALTDGRNYQPCISHDGKMADASRGSATGLSRTTVLTLRWCAYLHVRFPSR